MSLAQRITDLTTRIATEFKTTKNKIAGNNSGDLSGLATTAKTSILAAINELVSAIAGKQNNLGYTPENAANKGAANGYASLDSGGKVPSSQLPSFVDDVLEFANFAAFPGTGTAGIIYVALDTNITYRWGGSAYVEISQSLALGETSTSAYRGDRGAIAYNHSQSAHLTLGSTGTTAAAGDHLHDDRYYTEAEIGNPETDFVTTFTSNL